MQAQAKRRTQFQLPSFIQGSKAEIQSSSQHVGEDHHHHQQHHHQHPIVATESFLASAGQT